MSVGHAILFAAFVLGMVIAVILGIALGEPPDCDETELVIMNNGRDGEAGECATCHGNKW